MKRIRSPSKQSQMTRVVQGGKRVVRGSNFGYFRKGLVEPSIPNQICTNDKIGEIKDISLPMTPTTPAALKSPVKAMNTQIHDRSASSRMWEPMNSGEKLPDSKAKGVAMKQLLVIEKTQKGVAHFRDYSFSKRIKRFKTSICSFQQRYPIIRDHPEAAVSYKRFLDARCRTWKSTFWGLPHITKIEDQ